MNQQQKPFWNYINRYLWRQELHVAFFVKSETGMDFVRAFGVVTAKYSLAANDPYGRV